MPGAPSDSGDTRLRAAVECSPCGLLMTDRDGAIVLVNREIERLFGYPRAELLGHGVEILLPEHHRRGHMRSRAAFAHGTQTRALGAGRDLVGRRKDGGTVPVEIGLTSVPTDDGMFVLATIVDISARKAAEEEHRRLEAQLRQAKKMEAVGTLAGGIAHDFNNMLGVILGYVDVMRQAITDEERFDDLREMERAALRGRDLVRRILAFSRHADTPMWPLDVANALEQASKLMQGILPSHVELRWSVAPATPRIRADLTSFCEVIMNLGNNAVQAMPEGGLLEIVAEPLYVRDHVARSHPDLHEGPYVHLYVRDRGVGMDAATLERVFEPFFTTKRGTGTGLGMSMVHGIVRDHGGAVLVESTPGVGTKVRCFFPAIDAAQAELEAPTPVAEQGAGERVLLLDDEPALVTVGVLRLQQLGYVAAGFSLADEALRALRDASPAFDVVLTDYAMPEMDGLRFAAAVAAAAPGTPVLLLTGLIPDLPADELTRYGVRRVLLKPVETTELAAALREVLGRPGGAT